MDEDDLEETHFVYVLDDHGRLVGRLPLIHLLISDPATSVTEVMETDPLYVDVDLDQEEVAGFFQTHDLISLPVVDHDMKLVGLITADDVLDVMEDEATEDISRLAGVSKEEFGEQSSFRVARSRLPWLLGALVGQLGAVFVMSHFEQSLESMVALTFYIPMIMATAGNIGIQTSSVVVRGLATGEVDFYHLGRHLLRELGTAVLTGVAVAAFIYLMSWLVSGDPSLSFVLSLAMLLVVLFAAMAGSGHSVVAAPGRHRPGRRHRSLHHHRQRHRQHGHLPGTGLPPAEPRSGSLTMGVMSRPAASTEALVLRAWPCGESSAVVSLLTRDHGYVKVIAKAARSGRSRLRPLIEPGRLVTVEFSLDPGRELQFLRGGEVDLDPMAEEPTLEKSAYLLGALELVDRCRPLGGDPDVKDQTPVVAHLFAVCGRFVRMLSSQSCNRPALLFFAFEWELLARHGMAPEVSSCVACGRVRRGSGTLDPAVQPRRRRHRLRTLHPRRSASRGGRPLGKEAWDHLRDMARTGIDLDREGESTLARPLRREMGALLHRFLGYHLPGYRLPAALESAACGKGQHWMMEYQQMIANLQKFWSDYGCVIVQPYNSEVGAGTFNPNTFLRALGPEPWQGGLRGTQQEAQGRSLPGKSQPGPPVPAVPGHPQTQSVQQPGAVPGIAARAGDRSRRTRHPLRGGRLGIAHPGCRRPGLGSLAGRHGGVPVHLLPAGGWGPLQTGVRGA